MTEWSNTTIGSYSFETDNLNVIIGYAKDNQSFGTLLCEGESCEVKYDDEWLSDEDKDELLRQKDF